MNIEQLLNTPAGQQLAKDFNAEQDKQRSDLFNELDSIKQRRNSELSELNRSLEQATSACVAASAKMEAVKIRERTATAKLQQAKGSYSSQVARINKELMKSAPPQIDTFCESLHDEATKLRSTAIKTPPDMVYTNSVNARVSAIRDLVDKSTKLKLVDVADIGSTLQALRAGLPAIVTH